MARRGFRTSLRHISEVSMTPLMDLTFILLITFIITFPLLEQGVPVNLPVGGGDEIRSQAARTVTIDREGAIYLDETLVTLPALRARLSEAVQADPSLAVMVRADEIIRYGNVVAVLTAVRQAQVRRMALVTREDRASAAAGGR